MIKMSQKCQEIFMTFRYSLHIFEKVSIIWDCEKILIGEWL